MLSGALPERTRWRSSRKTTSSTQCRLFSMPQWPLTRPLKSYSAAFATDNGGAIPSNLLQYPNSESNSHYIATCKQLGVKSHPARFPVKLPEFFIKYLTDPGDLVLDIFSGSNTTGEAAELLDRNWLSFDLEPQYVAASAFRFMPKGTAESTVQVLYDKILSGSTADLTEICSKQTTLQF